jgi:hypothetical protein
MGMNKILKMKKEIIKKEILKNNDYEIWYSINEELKNNSIHFFISLLVNTSFCFGLITYLYVGNVAISPYLIPIISLLSVIILFYSFRFKRNADIYVFSEEFLGMEYYKYLDKIIQINNSSKELKQIFINDINMNEISTKRRL